MSVSQEVIDRFMQDGKKGMEQAIQHLHDELVKIRTGKASAAMLDGLLVSYYGTMTPINQLANIIASDAKTIVVQPWDKKALSDIEKSIFEANLGLTPQNDGEIIRISIPPLTEERRKELVKYGKSLGEDTKVSLRSTRHKMMDQLKKAVKDGYPEDAGKRVESRIDKMTQKFSDKADELVEAKNEDIMTV